jgi:hypothetical protein
LIMLGISFVNTLCVDEKYHKLEEMISHIWSQSLDNRCYFILSILIFNFKTFYVIGFSLLAFTGSYVLRKVSSTFLIQQA